jgi:hypothetical protein
MVPVIAIKFFFMPFGLFKHKNQVAFCEVIPKKNQFD